MLAMPKVYLEGLEEKIRALSINSYTESVSSDDLSPFLAMTG